MTLTKDQLLARAQEFMLAEYGAPSGDTLRDQWYERMGLLVCFVDYLDTHREGQASADYVRAQFSPGYKTCCYNEHCSQPAYDVGLEACPECGRPNLNFERYASEMEAPSPSGASAGSAVETSEKPLAVWPAYTTAVGEAGSDYMKSVSLDGRYHLSGTFRWYELWDAMNRAAVKTSAERD